MKAHDAPLNVYNMNENSTELPEIAMPDEHHITWLNRHLAAILFFVLYFIMMICIICMCACCNWFSKWKQKKQLEAHIAATSPMLAKSSSKNSLRSGSGISKSDISVLGGSKSGVSKSISGTVFQPNWQTEAGKMSLSESNHLLSNPGNKMHGKRRLSITLTDPDGEVSELNVIKLK